MIINMKKAGLPNFKYEAFCWENGYGRVAGIDEVGRGSFAGPVVAGCVVFLPDSKFKIPGPVVINDSKKLSSKQREKADKWIRENSLGFGVGVASAARIDKVGIKKASEVAFRKAISSCKLPINYLLIDAFYIPYVRGLRRRNQKAIVKGDERSVSIAAASIVAKVYRDRLMTKLGRNPKYRKYGWVGNKGYGTRAHRNAIKKHGVTGQHRKTFVDTWLSKTGAKKD